MNCTSRFLFPVLALVAAAILPAALRAQDATATAPPPAAPLAYTVDSAHTSVNFSIKHLAVARVHGRFNNPEGAIIYDPAAPEKSSIHITVKAENVDTGVAKRDEHLRKDDYFDVAKFPDITFKSTKLVKKSEGEFEATGDLTLKGVTKPVAFTFSHAGEIKDQRGGFRTGGEAKFTIKRSDFGMTTSIGPIADDVELTISIEATRP